MLTKSGSMNRRERTAVVRKRQTAAKAEEENEDQFYLSAELFPFLSEEELSLLRKEVVTSLNNELVRPEDLEVAVPRLLRMCVNESKELRRTVNSVASSQMLEAHRAVQSVRESSDRIKDLRSFFTRQGDLVEALEVTSSSYKQLRQLHFLRDNVSSVINWTEALKEVRYTNLYSLVEEQQFAAVYKRLRRLQSIRRTVMDCSRSEYRTYHSALNPYFEKLDVVQTMFVAGVYQLLEENSLHVAIQKALEDPPDVGEPVEEFVEYTRLEECLQICCEEMADGVLCGADNEPLITEEKVRRAVQKCVVRLWEEQIMVDVVNPFSQISLYLEQMKKVSPLLEALELALIPLSTKFSFFAIVVSAIHNEVIDVIRGYVDPEAEVEATGLLEASDFVGWYKELMLEANYEQYIDLQSIDGLSASMMALAVDGLSAHLVRLCRACAISVRSPGNRPTALPNGMPVTTGPMDMFTVLQQSLGGLSSAVEVPVMRQVGMACAKAIEGYLEECQLCIDYDFWEEENEQGTNPLPLHEWSAHRLAFLYAFTNDCSTIERNMDSIELKFASYWDEDEGSANISPFQRVQDLLSENILYYVDEIVFHVERVVSEKWELVFRSEEWYNSETNPIQIILNTMGEYIDEEFVAALDDQRVRMTVRCMLIRFTNTYLTRLVEFLGDVIRHPKSMGIKDWGSFTSSIQRDTTLSADLWNKRVKENRGQLADLSHRAFEAVRSVLSVKRTSDFSFVLQRNVLDDFADCPTFVIRFMLQARPKEVDKELRDAMMALWAERIAYQSRGPDDIPTAGWSRPPSFFGSLDRSLESLEKKAGMFRTSAKKKRIKAEKKKQETEKEAKKAARHARKEADAAALKVKVPNVSHRAHDDDVEVANLADILK